MTDETAPAIEEIIEEGPTASNAANVVILIDSARIPRGIVVNGFEIPCIAAARMPMDPAVPLQIHFEIYAKRVVTMTRESYERAKASGAEK
jgi:hypothetical protein